MKLLTIAMMIGAEPVRPNVVVVLADDLGFSDLGCYGGEIETPNLDRLAAGGLRYTQFYNTSRCWPTRAALLSGYYPQQIRMDPPVARLPGWVKLLPHHLKPAGYRCYQSGKWHIQGAPAIVKDGGFDHSLEVLDYDRNFSPQRRREDDRELPSLPNGERYFSTTAIVDHAVKRLEGHRQQHRARPFFSYVALTAPHFPLHAPAEIVAKYRSKYREGWTAVRKRRLERIRQLGIVASPPSEPEAAVRPPSDVEKAKKGLGLDVAKEVFHALDWEALSPQQQAFQADKFAVHAAMVDHMDQEIGRLINQLESMNAIENTLIVFLSDNGASAEILVRGDGHDSSAPLGSAASYLCLGPGGSTVANSPFRRHKMWVHEGGIATPMIVHWPKGFTARGDLCRAVGHVIDIVPTIADVAGVDLKSAADPSAPPRPGMSLKHLLNADATAHRELYFHHTGNRALRIGDWKIVSDGSAPNRWGLFNLADDRCETMNLAAMQPDRVRQMAARWKVLEDEFREQGYGDLPPEALRPQKKKK